jgi:hypothetical protein
MPIIAHAPVFSSRMPGKPAHDFPGDENRVRDRRLSPPTVSSERKMLARHRAGAGRCMPRYPTARLPGTFGRDAE